jgi:xylulokinase
VEFRSPARAARAVVEAQALAMQRYSAWIGERPSSILATGGASRNRGILQVVADVFGAEVRTLEIGNSSALGGALRAAQAVGNHSWKELFSAFAAPAGDVVARPNPSANYDALRARFAREVDNLLGL